MLRHCRRKLLGEYLPGEDRNQKAFGLLAGKRETDVITVSRCFPLLRNDRQSETHRHNMDRIMAEHAVPSETPFTERGWVAAPPELAEVLRECRRLDLVLVGSYHMHRVAWPDDPLRDTPTTLDKILGSDSRLLMFIMSMVNPDRPSLRAFHEGDIAREISVHYI